MMLKTPTDICRHVHGGGRVGVFKPPKNVFPPPPPPTPAQQLFSGLVQHQSWQACNVNPLPPWKNPAYATVSTTHQRSPFGSAHFLNHKPEIHFYVLLHIFSGSKVENIACPCTCTQFVCHLDMCHWLTILYLLSMTYIICWPKLWCCVILAKSQEFDKFLEVKINKFLDNITWTWYMHF